MNEPSISNGLETTDRAGTHRILLLLAIAVCGMGTLGSTAMIVALVRDGGIVGAIYDADMVLVPLCFVIGGLVGLLSAPCVIPCLLQRNLKVAVPIVYLPSLGLVVLYACFSNSLFYPLDCAVPAFIAVCVLSVISLFACPRAPKLTFGVCPQCGYDLRGDLKAGCPECGWHRADASD